MSATPQEVAEQAQKDSGGNVRLAKAKLTTHKKLMKSDAARDYLRKRQIARGGVGGEHYELQANPGSTGSAGEITKADGYIRTIYDMVDYYYGFMPAALGAGGSGATLGKADDTMMSNENNPAIANTVYGSEVWSLLNGEANIFALLEKRPWTKSGERYVDAYGHTLGEGGEEENAPLPETDHPSLGSFEVTPQSVAHNFDVSQIEQLLAGTGDDHFADDPFEWLRRWYGQGTEHQTGPGEHPKHLNVQLGSSLERDESASATFEDAMLPIDRLISDSAEAGNIVSAADANVYGFDRSSNEFESNVLNTGGTNVNFTLDFMDDAVREVRQNSGKDPETDDGYFWLTGWDTYQKIENEVGGKERLEPVRTTFGMNGVQTNPGDDVGITVQAYKEIPIFRTNDLSTDGISRMYLIDSNTLFIKQLLPTQFYSTGIDVDSNPFALDRLGNEGMFLSIAQTAVTNPKAQAKVINLK